MSEEEGQYKKLFEKYNEVCEKEITKMNEEVKDIKKNWKFVSEKSGVKLYKKKEEGQTAVKVLTEFFLPNITADEYYDFFYTALNVDGDCTDEELKSRTKYNGGVVRNLFRNKNMPKDQKQDNLIVRAIADTGSKLIAKREFIYIRKSNRIELFEEDKKEKRIRISHVGYPIDHADIEFLPKFTSSVVRGKLFLGDIFMEETNPSGLRVFQMSQTDLFGWIPATIINIALPSSAFDIAINPRDHFLDFKKKKNEKKDEGKL